MKMRLANDHGLVLIALLIAVLITSGCTGVSSKAHYNKQMPKVTRGYHLVKEGDTIYQLAWRYGWDYRELAAANNLKRPFVIYPNQRIKLYLVPPASRTGGEQATVSKNENKAKQGQRTSRATQSRASYRGKGGSGIKWIWPVKGTVLSGFKRKDPLRQGLKISIPKGSKVAAAAAGKVVYVGAGIRGLEQLVIVEHDNGYLSAYAHNRKIFKKEAEIVKAGEIIAETGSNGSGTSMLHFEIRHNGISVDPSKYLPK